MGVRVITEPKIYCEDYKGNFSLMCGEGDCVVITTRDKELYEGEIDQICCKSVVIIDDDYNVHEITIDNIEEVEKQMNRMNSK